MDTALTKELRMVAAGHERTWQAKLELRAADEIERLEKRVKELEQAKARNENDPEMAFDDELGWLHKDSLAVVNELRRQLADVREKFCLVEEALNLGLINCQCNRDRARLRGEDCTGWQNDETVIDKAIALIRKLRKEPCGP